MPVLEILTKQFPEKIIETHDFRGDETALIQKDALLLIMKFLKTDIRLDFNMLMDLTAVDYLWMGKKPRFEVVYHLYSLALKHRLRIKVPIEQKDALVDSIVSLWPAANWYEREVWDMFGIRFQNHPDLKRILLYEGFDGHPLRKDYPINKRQPLIGPKN
ncbi:MAG: NADH-quinone oxidoreductase subunit C [Candidatus Omnitrophica bacterium CG11_big_fil_rev_8_21_14_0_20_45_26]|uniref:NADH-quinone oxidoreductase subunit C n=1 Tax=Candidatus Abzuiibacterium crystallinum TaxID=1974748 RepID=A0A2H0LSK3_9BACT|nr:MAG: NADH-quinone oxidoreductase subunit C [Candidatus Omnitrophica bacterium CG11_big_fil_rev_8_21_14_0_20_45_26]PIW65434.1 MAG: NADH-quinone oxidoreductase subunit C [Candidatus Omnitrophica bacterium CG12_big_fil_rev_8_21_14_0_65_45_16]